jgi:ribose 5-phosphate isomerase B
MHIAVGGDHAGFELKEQIVPWLRSAGHEVEDLGAHTFDAEDDFPDFAFLVADSVRSGKTQRGIVVCGSGVGASVAANKVPGIRACLCHDTYTGRQGVEHDAMNVLCLGGRVIGIEVAKEVLAAFLLAEFIPEVRYKRRLEKVLQIESRELKDKS